MSTPRPPVRTPPPPRRGRGPRRRPGGDRRRGRAGPDRPGAPTFGSRTTMRVHQHRAGDVRRLPRRRSWGRATLNGADRRRRRAGRTAGSRWRTCSREHPGRRGPDGLLQRRRGPAPPRRPGGRQHLPLRDVVPGRRPALVRLLRPARPQGALRLTVAAPPEWTVLGNGPSVAEGPGRWRIVPPQPLSTYFVTLVAGPVRLGDRRARRHPAGLPRPRLAARRAAGRGGRPDRGHGAVLRLLPPAVRRPVPVRGVPPGVRARLQRRRDGEPGLRHLPRPLHLPRPGHPGRAGRPGRRHRARDGPPCGSATW